MKIMLTLPSTSGDPNSAIPPFPPEIVKFLWLPLLLIIVVSLACSRTDPLQAQAEAFFELRDAGKLSAARKLIAPGARMWFEARRGEGKPWSLDDPWMTWDQVFNTRRDYRDWSITDSSVSVTSLGHSDFDRMVEREPVPARLTLFFDDSRLITGFLIQPQTEQEPEGKLPEFIAWAAKKYPHEVTYLMPEGQLNPKGDRPERLKRLLYEWRNATGKSPVE